MIMKMAEVSLIFSVTEGFWPQSVISLKVLPQTHFSYGQNDIYKMHLRT